MGIVMLVDGEINNISFNEKLSNFRDWINNYKTAWSFYAIPFDNQDESGFIETLKIISEDSSNQALSVKNDLQKRLFHTYLKSLAHVFNTYPQLYSFAGLNNEVYLNRKGLITIRENGWAQAFEFEIFNKKKNEVVINSSLGVLRNNSILFCDLFKHNTNSPLFSVLNSLLIYEFSVLGKNRDLYSFMNRIKKNTHFSNWLFCKSRITRWVGHVVNSDN
jgi:hypothetical protein